MSACDVVQSLIRDESGNVGGVFAAVSETSARVFSERRLRALRELAERSAHKSLTPAVTCATAAEILARNPSDVPFCQLYLVDEHADDARRLLLAGDAGLPDGHPLRMPVVDASHPHPWALLDALDSPGLTEVTPTPEIRLPGGRWPEPSSRAVVMPIRASGEKRAVGVFVAGVSPRLAFDDDYRGFFDLVANQIETSVSNALAFQEATARAEALAAIDRAKTAFFSNVSHEFRTPLTLMLGPLEDSLADAAVPLPSAHRERMELIRRNSVRLLKLVNTLLDFSRIEAGRTKAAFAPTDLAALIERLYSDRLDAKAKEYFAHATSGAERMARLIRALLSYAQVGSESRQFTMVPLEAAVLEAMKNLAQRIAETNADVHVGDLPSIRGDHILLVQLEDNSIQSGSTTSLEAALGWRWKQLTAQVLAFNLRNSQDHDIDYFYASRLQGEPAGGVKDVHYHPVEPFTVRGTVTWTFRPQRRESLCVYNVNASVD